MTGGGRRVAVRPTGPGELPGLAALFAERFGHPWTEEEWAWKYRNPLGGPAGPGGSESARSWVAVDEGAGGRVVAHAGALRFPARLGAGGSTGSPPSPASTARGIWQLTDWMGSVGAGGLRPPLVTLGRALLAELPGPDDAPWIFGFPSERHLRLGRRTFGYRRLPGIQPLAGALAEAAEAALAGGAAPEGAIREVTDHCGDWAEEAWEACGVAGVRRSAAFLNWRYHARPGRYYRVYRLAPSDRSDGGPDGLAVFAFVAALGRGAELWLPGPPERAAERWASALGAVALDLAAAGLERWQLWPPPPGSGVEPLLRGLRLGPEGDPVIMGCRGRGGTTDGPSPADPSFYYSMGDYDSV